MQSSSQLHPPSPCRNHSAPHQTSLSAIQGVGTWDKHKAHQRCSVNTLLEMSSFCLLHVLQYCVCMYLKRITV